MSEDNLLKFLVDLATNDDQRARFSAPETRQQSMDLASLTPEEQTAINTGDPLTVRRKLGLQDGVPFNQAGHSAEIGGRAKPAGKAKKAKKAGVKKAGKAAKKAAKAGAKKAAKKAPKKAAKAAKKGGGRKR